MRKNSKIAELSKAFISRFRVTILMVVAIIVLGGMAVTTFLPRNGFPEIAFAASFVRVNYAGDNPEQIEDEIIGPITQEALSLDAVESVNSTSTANGGTLFIQYNSEYTSEDGTALLKEEVEAAVNLPANADLTFNEIDPASFDPETGSSVFLSLYDAEKPNISDEVLVQRAQEFADQVDDAKAVSSASVFKPVREIPGPQGQIIQRTLSFNKVGIKNDSGELVFHNSIILGLAKSGNQSDDEFSQAIREQIDSFDNQGLDVEYTVDVAQDTNRQIESLVTNLTSAVIIVAIMVLIFVGWRSAISIIFFIPLVLLMVFALLFAAGGSLNVISLFGLILALGLFVDDAIVVIESIDAKKRAGLKGVDAVQKAIAEIGAADVLGTLTTGLVFAPLLFIPGILGEFISEFPRSVVIALLSSLFIALTVMPFLTNFLIADKSKKKKNGWQKFIAKIDTFFSYVPNFMLKIGEALGRYTKAVLNSTVAIVATVVVTIVILGGSFSLMSHIAEQRFNPFPSPSDGEAVEMSFSRKSDDTSVAEIRAFSTEVDSFVKDNYSDSLKKVEYFMTQPTSAQAFITLKDYDERDIEASEIVDELLAQFDKPSNENVSFYSSVVSGGPPSTQFPVTVQVYGDDIENMENLATDIVNFLKEQEVDGVTVTETKIENTNSLSKLDGRRYIEVQAKVTDPSNFNDIQEFQTRVTDEFDEEKLTNKYDLEADALGTQSEQDDNVESLSYIPLLGLLGMILIYGLLVWQFRSFTQPLLIIVVAVLLAIPGVAVGLELTGNFLGFFSSVGMVGLIGIVVNNTIMLVDFANQSLDDGKSPSEAISQAISVRFRPLVTTSITTILGLLPLALNDPFWEPLAFTIIFGLLSSTLFVLFVFPVFYVLLEWSRNKVKGWFV